MSRTQVYLGEEELGFLDRAAEGSGASRSELIRRAVRAVYGERSADQRLHALQLSAGAWGPGESGAEYVDARRRADLNQRLARHGLG